MEPEQLNACGRGGGFVSCKAEKSLIPAAVGASLPLADGHGEESPRRCRRQATAAKTTAQEKESCWILLRWGLRFRSPMAMGRRALAAAADRRQPQKQQHKKKKAAGSCCCWLLLLWWVASLRSPLAMGGGPPGFRASDFRASGLRTFGLPGFRASDFRAFGLPGFGLPGFRTSGLPGFRASDFRASVPGFGLPGFRTARLR